MQLTICPSGTLNPVEDLDAVISSLDGLAMLMAESDGAGSVVTGLALNLSLHCELLRAVSTELHNWNPAIHTA